MSPSPERQTGNFRHADLAELRHRFRTPMREILAGAEILIEEASTLKNGRALDLLRHIHSAGLAALNDVGRALGNRDAVEAAEVELLSEKVRPRVDRVLTCIEELDGDSGPMPDDWTSDIDRIAFNARTLVRLMETVPDMSAAGEKAEDGEEKPEAGGPRVLVVGGDPTERRVVCRRLARQGYSPLDAADSSAAMDMVASEPFDLVILDLMMPAMSAFDLLEKMKSNQRLRKIGVIVVAALDETDRVVRALQMGAEDYLLKPFEPTLLRARVNSQLERKRLREQVASLRRREKT